MFILQTWTGHAALGILEDLCRNWLTVPTEAFHTILGPSVGKTCIAHVTVQYCGGKEATNNSKVRCLIDLRRNLHGTTPTKFWKQQARTSPSIILFLKVSVKIRNPQER
jgi:hypothetical protein